MLRAGLTEVLVTGMLIRWISVSARPMASGAKPAGARLSVDAEDDQQEEEGQHHLARPSARAEGVCRRRVLAVAVGGEAAGEREARLARGDHVEHRRGARWRPPPARPSRARSPASEAAAGPQAERHRRVEMAAGDVADGIGHGEHGEAEGERDAGEADADDRESAAASTALPQPPSTSQNVPKNSAPRRCVMDMIDLLPK